MTVETNTRAIPYPADGNTFETWCKWIARYEFADSNADFYGRGGQKQSGIDIIATRGAASRIGMQCKTRQLVNELS